MRSLLMSALTLAFAAPAYARGFYGRADLHGNLTRCAANGGVQMWSCGTNNHEAGAGLDSQLGYAPAAWLDLGVEAGVSVLASSRDEGGLGSAHVMPVVRVLRRP